MTIPKDFYTSQLTIHQQALADSKKKLTVSSILRLTVFLLMCLGIYVGYGNAKIVAAVLLVSIVLFVILVTRHNKLQYARDLEKAIILQNEKELLALKDGKRFPYRRAVSQF